MPTCCRQQPPPPSPPTSSIPQPSIRSSRLFLFGLELSTLPPIGTSPSLANPLVNPLAVSLGIDYKTPSDGGNRSNPSICLIHAARVNDYDPNQKQIFLVLNDASCTGFSCPSNSSSNNGIYFWADVLCPLKLEVLDRLTREDVLRPTGNIIPESNNTTTAHEYEVCLDPREMSKKCERCGRWESLDKNSEEEKQRTGQRWRYRRWFACAGCPPGTTFYCRQECAKAVCGGAREEKSQQQPVVQTAG